jgi:glucans biosynthesis protein C
MKLESKYLGGDCMQESEEEKMRAAGAQERCHYIDWLRIIGMLIVFFFHNLRFFDSFGWELKNKETSFLATVLVVYINLWIMPLFFLLAGASSKFALSVKTTAQYAVERCWRLFAPFVVGVLTLIPPQRYVEYLNKGRFTGTFSEFVPWYFGEKLFSANFGFDPQWFGNIGTHLWFLAALFVFSLAGIPVFTYVIERGKSFVEQLAGIVEKPGGIFLFSIPLMLIRITLRPISTIYSSWGDFAFWFLLFLYGYIIVADRRFVESASRNKYVSLLIGVSSMIVILICHAMGCASRWFDYPDYSAGAMIFHILWGAITWSMLVFFLGIGKAYLDREHKLLRTLSEAVMPFYMLHQTVILLIGYHVISGKASIAVKFGIISSLSLLVVCGLCYLIMTRMPWLRPVFGMKPLKNILVVSRKSNVINRVYIKRNRH